MAKEKFPYAFRCGSAVGASAPRIEDLPAEEGTWKDLVNQKKGRETPLSALVETPGPAVGRGPSSTAVVPRPFTCLLH